jgi:hypothetical protein
VAPNRKIPASIGNVIPVAQFVIVTLLTELSWLTKPNYTKIKNDVFGRKRSRPDSATIPTLNDKELTKWKKKKKKKHRDNRSGGTDTNRVPPEYEAGKYSC